MPTLLQVLPACLPACCSMFLPHLLDIQLWWHVEVGGGLVTLKVVCRTVHAVCCAPLHLRQHLLKQAGCRFAVRSVCMLHA